MASNDDYVQLASELIEQDVDRDAMFARMDRIWRIEWELPTELKAAGWIKPVRSSDGHDALRGTARILSSREPRITVWPTSEEPEAKEKADRLERSLRWFMVKTLMKNQTSVLRDVVMSAAKYDEICGQVIYLPYQKKLLEGMGALSDENSAAMRRLRAMERSGPFTVVVRNPRFVHTMYSEYGVEAVCFAAAWDASKLVAFYGNRAEEIQKKIDSGDAASMYAVWDICDYSKRFAFAVPLADSSFSLPTLGDKMPKDSILLLDDPNDLNFIPWICKVGGTSLETDNENTHVPMLYSVDHANQYDIQNALNSIVFSDAVVHAAAPRGKKSGPGAENIQVEHYSPENDVILQPGQDYEPLLPPVVDQGLLNLSEWIAGRVEKSTIPRVLQGGNVTAETFATLNLAVSSGMITIDPYKKLSEQWLSEMAVQMLLWVKKGGEKVTAASKRRESETSAKEIIDVFTLDPAEIDEKGLFIDIQLEAETPVDKQTKINGAQMLEKMGYPKRVALEEVGATDASALLDEARYEAMEEFFLQRFFNKIGMRDRLEELQASTQIQTEAQLAAQQAAVAMQAEAAAAAPPPQEPPPGPQYQMPGGGIPEGSNEPVPGTPPGMMEEGVEGSAWNPAEGGLPPAVANPSRTMEGQTGMTRGGSEVA